jgi:hypothetical protein
MINSSPMTGRLPIIIKDAKPLVPGRKTFFFLSGELRNQIYDLVLDKQYQRVPLNPCYLNKPDPYIALPQTCSQVYQEARGYLVEKQVAYIPVMAGMQFNYGGELSEDYGLSKETTDTIAASLTDFMQVHFHLHVDLLAKPQKNKPCSLIDANGQEWNISLLLDSLHQAIKQYIPHSWDRYFQHGLGKRRAIVHLDHLLSLWPKLSEHQPCVPICAMRDLVNLLAQDTMTLWQIRYYVPTGQAHAPIAYGSVYDDEEMSSALRNCELAQLRYYANTCGHDNILIFAEMCGEDNEWEFGDNAGSVTRRRTPATEFWPILHFDPWRYHPADGRHLQRSYPGESTTVSTSLFN